MKKSIPIPALLAACIASTALLGCDKPKEGAGPVEPVVLRLAETHPADYPTTRGDFKFAELAELYSEGRIKIEVYPSAQLGEEKAAIEQVQFGAIDFTRTSISPMAAFAPQLNALQLPYVFRDGDHEFKVLKGQIGDELLSSGDANGFVGLAWYDSGSRNFYTTKKLVKGPEDIKGLKIRVMQSDVPVKMINALGGVATPMAYGEVYSALQTGVIDGAENNWPSYLTSSHYEVAKYYVLDGHTRVPEILVASKITFDKLPAKDQEAIRKAAKDSMDYQIAEWKAFEKVAEEKIRASGVTITELKDTSGFAAAMEKIYAE
jgi:tripartite ATP-independent transporter DctP family solute receptor